MKLIERPFPSTVYILRIVKAVETTLLIKDAGKPHSPNSTEVVSVPHISEAVEVHLTATDERKSILREIWNWLTS